MLKRYTKNDCVMLPYAAITCRYDHCCHICDVADRVRKNSRIHTRDINELFDYYDVLPKTAKGGGSEYLYRPIILKPEAMKSAGIEVDMYNQIFVTTDGAGMFSYSPGSQIDGYLLSDRSKIYTFGRGDFYGVPNDKAVRRFKDLFLIDLTKFERSVVRMI